MDEAIIRLQLAADAGADVCFIEGVKSKQLLEATVAALAPKPVCVSLTKVSLIASRYLYFCPDTCQCHIRWFDPILHYN